MIDWVGRTRIPRLSKSPNLNILYELAVTHRHVNILSDSHTWERTVTVRLSYSRASVPGLRVKIVFCDESVQRWLDAFWKKMNTDWIKKADIGICETDKRRTRMIYTRGIGYFWDRTVNCDMIRSYFASVAIPPSSQSPTTALPRTLVLLRLLEPSSSSWLPSFFSHPSPNLLIRLLFLPLVSPLALHCLCLLLLLVRQVPISNSLRLMRMRAYRSP